MIFYTSIFKFNYRIRKWIFLLFVNIFLISVFITLFNFIVDPYNITNYNLLDIKYKFARDDRTEKVNYFQRLPQFDNIMIGSSRVYSINPLIVSKYLGGNTYNFGVGTATVEDHLGILKYLIRIKKIPKNIILGVDFYTFNPNIPPNSYFLRNKELNFLSYTVFEENIFSKIFSHDALKGSVKTLKQNYLQKAKPRFDKFGWYKIDTSKKISQDIELMNVKKKLRNQIRSCFIPICSIIL